MRLTGIQALLASMMTFKEVCEMLGKSERSVRYYHSSCGLPGMTVGHALYFDPKAVQEWIAGREIGPKGRFKDLGGDAGLQKLMDSDEIGGPT